MEETLLGLQGKRVSAVIDGVSYLLSRLTCLKELEICEQLSMDEKTWKTNLQEMDTKSICITLFNLIEDRVKFKDWKSVANVISSDGVEKFSMLAAIAACMNEANPEVVAMIDNSKKKIEQMMKKMRKDAEEKINSLGQESSTSSPSITVGQS